MAIVAMAASSAVISPIAMGTPMPSFRAVCRAELAAGGAMRFTIAGSGAAGTRLMSIESVEGGDLPSGPSRATSMAVLTRLPDGQSSISEAVDFESGAERTRFILDGDEAARGGALNLTISRGSRRNYHDYAKGVCRLNGALQ